MSELKKYLDESANLPQGYGPENGFFYSGFQDFVSKEGKLFVSSELTNQEKEHFQKVFSISKANKLGECFYNAQILAMTDSSDLIEYWEGYTTSNGFPILHGFNTINGKIIDVTHKVKRKPILGVFEDKEYIGVQFPTKWMIERLESGKNSTSFIDNFADGWPVLKKKWKSV